jgi:protein TonB
MRDQQSCLRDEAGGQVNARGGAYTVSFLAALGLHAGLLFGWSRVFPEQPEFGMDAGEAVEVLLVEAAGEPIAEVAPVPETPEPPPPEPESPPPPEPILEPPPPPEPLPSEVIEPTPAPPKPVATPRPARRPATTTPAQPAPGAASGVPGKPATSGPSGVRTQAKPNYLRNPPPPYPPASRQAGEHGVVTLLVSVSEDGRATSVRLKRSSGFARLDASALNAVQRWRFSPSRIGNVAIASEVEVPVRFKLE